MMNLAKSARRNTPPATPIPIPTLSPIDKLEDFTPFEVIEDVEVVVGEVEEVVSVDAAVLSDVVPCGAVEPGV
jgi:hypothetical protein